MANRKNHWTNFTISAELFKEFQRTCEQRDCTYSGIGTMLLRDLLDNGTDLVPSALCLNKARFRFMIDKALYLLVRENRRKYPFEFSRLFEAKMRQWIEKP